MVPIELKHIQKISQIRLNPDENIEHNNNEIIKQINIFQKITIIWSVLNADGLPIFDTIPFL